MYISICKIKECVAIFPVNPLDCFQEFVGGRQKTNPKRSQFQGRMQNTEYSPQDALRQGQALPCLHGLEAHATFALTCVLCAA
jgi:hypothetical protein